MQIVIQTKLFWSITQSVLHLKPRVAQFSFSNHLKGNIDEYSMIEFQGDLETKSEEALGNKVIGDLHFNHEGNPIMIIGHHILHGKVQELEKPLVVITKENDDEPDENVKYSVTAVISKKLIFKTRPKPIVGEMIKKL